MISIHRCRQSTRSRPSRYAARVFRALASQRRGRRAHLVGDLAPRRPGGSGRPQRKSSASITVSSSRPGSGEEQARGARTRQPTGALPATGVSWPSGRLLDGRSPLTCGDPASQPLRIGERRPEGRRCWCRSDPPFRTMPLPSTASSVPFTRLPAELRESGYSFAVFCPGYFRMQRVKSLLPQRSVPIEPAIDLGERFRTQAVDAKLCGLRTSARPTSRNALGDGGKHPDGRWAASLPTRSPDAGRRHEGLRAPCGDLIPKGFEDCIHGDEMYRTSYVTVQSTYARPQSPSPPEARWEADRMRAVRIHARRDMSGPSRFPVPCRLPVSAAAGAECGCSLCGDLRVGSALSGRHPEAQLAVELVLEYAAVRLYHLRGCGVVHVAGDQRRGDPARGSLRKHGAQHRGRVARERRAAGRTS